MMLISILIATLLNLGYSSTRNFPTNSEKQIHNDSIIVVSGFLLKGETGDPVANRVLTLRFYEKAIDSTHSIPISTDQDGFYFWKNSSAEYNQFKSYTLDYEGHNRSLNIYTYQESLRQSSGVHFFHKYKKNRRVTILRPARRNEFYQVHQKGAIGQLTDSLWVKKALLELLPGYKRENHLITTFERYHNRDDKLIIKLEDAYFSKEGNLLGYEGNIDFYLDGEKSAYTKINDTFHRLPVVEMFSEPGSNGLLKEMWFYDYVRYRNLPSELVDSSWVNTPASKFAINFKKEKHLVNTFKASFHNTKLLICKIEDMLFYKSGHILGNDGTIEFYLDGLRSTDSVINATFQSRSPAEIHVKQDSKGIINQMWFYASGLDAELPPTNLLIPENLQWVDPGTFDLANLSTGPYYLNGYWQVEGWGPNIKPEKALIKRVALFTGKLAQHYNFRFERLWWIETKPTDQVWARPEFSN